MTEKKLDSRSVLVTGATGYIGGNLVKRLVKEGWEVHIIVRPNSSLGSLAPILHSLHVHVYQGSTEEVFQIVQTAKPVVVLHLASFATVSYVPEEILPMLHSNIIFGTQLMDAMARNQVFHLINTGTYSQHFNDEEYNPQSIYAATKQAFEDIALYYSESTPMKLLTLTLFDSYGPHDPRAKIIPLLIKTLRGNIPLEMSPGEQQLDLVFIDDIVDAYLMAIERILDLGSSKTEKFTVTAGRRISLREVVSAFERVSNSTLPIVWGGRPYRDREVMIPWTKGIPLPGWRAAVSFEEGIRRIVNAEGD